MNLPGIHKMKRIETKNKINCLINKRPVYRRSTKQVTYKLSNNRQENALKQERLLDKKNE